MTTGDRGNKGKYSGGKSNVRWQISSNMKNEAKYEILQYTHICTHAQAHAHPHAHAHPRAHAHARTQTQRSEDPSG
jgi:hypothetical protein